jgi:homoserine dehydrogenase
METIEGQINVGLMGLGVVGTGVAAALVQQNPALFDRTGLALNLKKVLVRDAARPREVQLPPGTVTTNAEDILADPDIHIVVEVMGGSDPAGEYLKKALSSGKHVVTANKEVMAKQGPELFALARANKVNLLFEASVGGGIPIVGCLMNELAANEVQSIRSIINGTTNYILTRMAHERTSFQQALGEAQEQGYAEADPTNDVEGIDAAYKLTILASLAYHHPFAPEDVFREGISNLEPQDFRYAQELGYAIKSLAIAGVDDSGARLRVYPAMVPEEHMLAKVDGVYNAVEVEGSLCGQVLFHGMGAGRGPTTSAVVGDLLEAARIIKDGGLPVSVTPPKRQHQVNPIDDLITKYYIRLNVADQAGVLAQIAKELGDGDISIASVLQKDTDPDTQSADIVITTHPAREASVQRALQAIGRLDAVRRVSNMLRIEE